MKSLAAVATKILLVLVVLVIGSSAAWAGFLNVDLTNVTCCAYTTGALDNVTFSNFSSTIPAGSTPNEATVYFYYPTPASPGSNLFRVVVNTAPSAPLTAGDAYTFDYTVAVGPNPSGQASWIYEVGVSLNGQASTDSKVITVGGTTVTTIVTPGTEVDSSSGLLLQTFNVAETITLAASGSPSVDSFTDYFYETSEPEPATMALMGTGLVVLGALLRRRKLAK